MRILLTCNDSEPLIPPVLQSITAVFRYLHTFARPNDVELELSPREGYELVKDGALQRPGTPLEQVVKIRGVTVYL